MTMSSQSLVSLQSSQPVASAAATSHKLNGYSSSSSNYPHHNQTAYRASSSHLQTPVTVTDSSSYAAVRAPDLPLTGAAEADADILAFLKARQNAIQLGECALCHSLVV